MLERSTGDTVYMLLAELIPSHQQHQESLQLCIPAITSALAITEFCSSPIISLNHVEKLDRIY